MVIFSRFQTELFAYSPLSAASCSVVDSFNLLNAISAFCSSRRSGLVLTLSPQQITVIPKGLEAGVQDPLSAGVRTRDLTPPRPSGTQPQEHVGAVWGCPGWLPLLARPAAHSACQLQRKKKKQNTFLQKKVTSPSSGHSPGHSVLGMECDCRVTPEQRMPANTEQRSHQSRAPGEHLHKKGKHQLLLESSSCCSLSPGSSTTWPMPAMEQH